MPNAERCRRPTVASVETPSSGVFRGAFFPWDSFQARQTSYFVGCNHSIAQSPDGTIRTMTILAVRDYPHYTPDTTTTTTTITNATIMSSTTKEEESFAVVGSLDGSHTFLSKCRDFCLARQPNSRSRNDGFASDESIVALPQNSAVPPPPQFVCYAGAEIV